MNRRNLLGGALAAATLPTVAVAAPAVAPPPTLRRNHDGPLTSGQMDDNFSNLDARLARLEYLVGALRNDRNF